jgi:hypothetical protein
MANNIVAVSLATLIMLLSAGIHQWTCHIPTSGLTQPRHAEGISPRSEWLNPGTDHCNACFFNQLLRQCLFTAFVKPAPAGFFRIRPRLHRTQTVFLNPSPKVNRSPPPAARLF